MLIFKEKSIIFLMIGGLYINPLDHKQLVSFEEILILLEGGKGE
jgi:hypothetical protein